MSKVVIAGDASGTGTFTISAPNGNTDRTLVLPDEAGTVLTSASNIAQQSTQNQVSFACVLSTDQNVSSNTWTKITFDSALLDSNGFFDTTVNKFQPTIAGWYQINLSLSMQGSSIARLITRIYKNGANFRMISYNSGYTSSAAGTGSFLLYMNGSTDYLEGYGYPTATSPKFKSSECEFSGFLVRVD